MLKPYGSQYTILTCLNTIFSISHHLLVKDFCRAASVYLDIHACRKYFLVNVSPREQFQVREFPGILEPECWNFILTWQMSQLSNHCYIFYRMTFVRDVTYGTCHEACFKPCTIVARSCTITRGVHYHDVNVCRFCALDQSERCIIGNLFREC